MITGMGVYDPGIGVYALGIAVYAPKIRRLCSKSENNNHLSRAEARARLSLAIRCQILAYGCTNWYYESLKNQL